MKLKTTLLGISVLLLFGTTAAVNAQTTRDPIRVDRLAAKMVGSWHVLAADVDQAGTIHEASEESMATIVPLFEGVALQEDVKIRAPGSGHDLLVTYSWEPTINKYRVAILDRAYGILDIYEGDLEGNTLLVDNLATATRFETASGARMAFRLRWEFLSESSFRQTIELTRDEGANWAPFMRNSYRRASTAKE
jgi:hypothetical protein